MAMSSATSAEDSSAELKRLEDLQANSAISSAELVLVLSNLLDRDKAKTWETRLLNVIWKFSHCISEGELVFCLSKVARHYTPEFPEIKSQENFSLTSIERENLLSGAGMASFNSNDISEALDEASDYGKKVKFWAEKEDSARHNSTVRISKLANALAIDIPIAARNNTAKECLHRLDLARAMGPDLNPHKSDTLASVMSTIMLPEEQFLKALQNETEVYFQAVVQVVELNVSHHEAYEVMKTEQLEKLDKFFQTCQKQKEDVIKEALYKKAKVLASINNVSINDEDVKLSSEDFLKRLLHEAGGALKKAEGKQSTESLERERNNECAICYSKFSMKRKRACLDPCGHANACFGCASNAWKRQPNCPWCETVVKKPIPLPPTLYL